MGVDLVLQLQSLLGFAVGLPSAFIELLNLQRLTQLRGLHIAELFRKLHGVSSILFLLQSALGVYLVWRLTKPNP